MASVPLIALGALLIHAPPRLGRGDRAGVAIAGLPGASATTAFALASQRWPLALVAVLVSLYPVTTVVLAHARLGERLSAAQMCSVGVVLSGVALIVAG